jgi:hypothetical protein
VNNSRTKQLVQHDNGINDSTRARNKEGDTPAIQTHTNLQSGEWDIVKRNIFYRICSRKLLQNLKKCMEHKQIKKGGYNKYVERIEENSMFC